MRTRLAILVLLAIAACGDRAPMPENAADDTSAIYVDVRTDAEFAQAHVRGAVHIPHDQMAQRWRELGSYRNRRMIVYCRTGRRSEIALEVLRANGFMRAENGGGLEQLAASGIPVINGDTVVTFASGPKACALLSSEDVAAATGVAFEPGVTAHDYGGSSQCRFDHEDGTQGVMFTVHTQGEIENYRKVPGSEAVAGLGDAAVWNPGTSQLAVSVGDVVFSISFLTTPPRRQSAIQLAKQITAKLNG